jgi:hypothetical protein
MLNDDQVKNFKFIGSNYVELSKKYNNKWIAVIDQQVVEFADSDREVKLKAEKKFKDRKEKLSGLMTEFVTMKKFPAYDV